MGQTTRGKIDYPEAGSNGQLWTHFANMANDVDGLIGLTQCTSGARPSTPFVGMEIYETDTKLKRIWDGTAWQCTGWVGAPNTYTPVLYDGDVVASSSGLNGEWMRLGQELVWARAEGIFTNATTNGAEVSMPVQSHDRRWGIGCCGLYGTGTPAGQSGHAWQANDLSGVSRLVVVNFANQYLNAASGNVIRMTVIYRCIAGL